MTRRNLGLILLIAALIPSALRAAGDWPQFRGPGGQGISTAAHVPVEWSATKNVAWKVDVPGRGWSSPVLADGRLYLTTGTANGNGPLALSALCFDAQTGKIIWQTEIFQPTHAAARQMHGKNTLASATPIVSGDRVYVHFGHLGTAALDLTGKILWRQTDLSYEPVHGNGGSPVLMDGLLICACDGSANPFVAALDAGTGAVKWKTPRNTPARNKFSFSTPLVIKVDGTAQVISAGSGLVGAYNPANGREIWRVLYGEGYSVVPRPVFADGLLFVSSGFDLPKLYAIRPQGAQGDVTRTHVAWTGRSGAPTTPSPLVIGDELYSISDIGLAICADAKTGKIHWTHRLNGGFSASPVTAEGRIYFQNEAGRGYVIQASKKYKLLAENDLDERSLASYAVTDHALYIRTESHLWKIGAGNPK